MELAGQDNSSTHKFIAYSAAGQVWNGAAYENWVDANIATYLIAAAALGTTATYSGTIPATAAYVQLWVWTGTLSTSYPVNEQAISVNRSIAINQS